MNHSPARRALPVVFLAALAAVAIAALWMAASVLLLLFGAVLFAILLRAVSEAFSRLTGVPLPWSLAPVVIILLAVAALTVWFILPGLTEEFERFVEELPETIRQVEAFLERFGWRGRPLTGDDGFLSWLEDPERITQFGAVALTWTMGATAWLLVTFFIGVYVAINPGLYKRIVVQLVPPQYRARAAQVIDEVGHTLRWWLITRVISMAAVGVLTTVMLWLLGLPLAVALGLIAFVLTFVPYLGPIAATIPIAIVALTEGADMLVYAVALYTAIQSLEGFVVMPMAQNRLVHLPPAATLVSEVLMGVWFGLSGVVFATPLAAAMLPFVRLVYLEDVLGDRQDERPARRA